MANIKSEVTGVKPTKKDRKKFDLDLEYGQIREDKIADMLIECDMHIPKERWFTNLKTKGNVGAGSIYLMVDELFNSGKLKKGDKVLLAVPESSRFSYVFSMLTVC